jgi:hypothetical protein
MLEHIVLHVDEFFYLMLGFPAITLTVIVGTLYFLIVDEKLQYIRLSTALNSVRDIPAFKINRYYHVLAVSFVD